MSSKTTHGERPVRHSDKCKAPKGASPSILLNIADQCAKTYKFHQSLDGLKWAAINFWEVIVYAVLFSLGIEDASNRLNKIKIAEENKKLRRKKAPGKLGGKYERNERLVPDRSQVNDFKRKLPAWFVKNLEHRVLKAQVDYLLGIKVLPRRIDVIVDFNDKPYYGKLKLGDSQTITGTTKARGTHRVRKFLGVLIKSNKLRVFTHFNLARKGVSHDVFVKEALGDLLSWGFTIRRVLADRWFANRGVLEWCKDHGIEYIGPIKKGKKIINLIHQFLKTGKDILVQYSMQGDPTRYGTKNPLQVWIFFAVRDKERLAVIRRMYKEKKLKLDEATNKIHVFVVTSQPPRNKQDRAAWLRGLAKFYKTRWYIETAFSDLNRIAPTCHARTDAAKIFCTMMRCWLYNAWQIQREVRRRLRGVPASWRHGPTFREFCESLYEAEYLPVDFCDGVMIKRNLMSERGEMIQDLQLGVPRLLLNLCHL